MRASKIGVKRHVCLLCDRRDQADEDATPTLRDGLLNEFSGWKDEDGDWLDVASGVSEDDIDEWCEENDYERDTVEPHTYYTCQNFHDSDDYAPEDMKDVFFAWVCGVCGEIYYAIEDAADCCAEKEQQ